MREMKNKMNKESHSNQLSNFRRTRKHLTKILGHLKL